MKRPVVPHDVGERLRDFRRAKDLTQGVVGKAAGRNAQQVSLWERGRHKPSMGALERIAGRFGVPIEMFLEGPMPSERLGLKAGGHAKREVESPEAPEGAGWMFGDPSEAEEQFRSYIRNIERTHRMMVADPNAIPSDGIRRVQLDAVRLAMDQCELGGRPVPEFLHRVRNELIQSVFR